MVREAKDFIKAQIKKGTLTHEEFSNSHSVFNRLKELLRNNVGYVGFFTRAHYKDPENVTYERLENLFYKLLVLKQYNDPVDISKWTKNTFEEFEAHVLEKANLKLGLQLPGIIIERDFPEIHRKLNNKNWQVVICVKPEGQSWKPDIETLRAWGSPKWCIKRENYFSGTYVKNENCLQYVIIERKFFDQVQKASSEGRHSNLKLVPNNYGTDWDKADHYTNPVTDNSKRFGVTTKSSENLSFFNEKESLTCFDDHNTNVSTMDRLAKMTGNFPIRLLDIEVRRALGLNRSEFDISIPTLKEIMQFINLKYRDNELEIPAEELGSACGKFVSMMEKLMARPDDFEQVRKQIEPYFLENPKMLRLMTYAVLYAGELSPRMIDILEDMTQVSDDDNNIQFKSNKLAEINVAVTISLLHIYIENKKKGMYIDPELERIVDTKIVEKFLLKYSILSFICDNPKSIVDLKRAMIIVFRTGKIYEDIDAPGSRSTRAKLLKLLANYLYLFRKDLGEKVIQEQGWQDEIDFIQKVKDQAEKGQNENSEWLERTARMILDKFPKIMVERTDDDRRIVPTYADIFDEMTAYEEEDWTYTYTNHMSVLMTCLFYYTHKINPAIKKEYLNKKVS